MEISQKITLLMAESVAPNKAMVTTNASCGGQNILAQFQFKVVVAECDVRIPHNNVMSVHV